MQIVIDIPEEIYESQRYAQYFGAWSVVLQKHFENSTPIPDNATNGDVIKAMFPKDVKVITQHDDIFGRRFIDLRVGQLDCELDNDWWNAPY